MPPIITFTKNGKFGGTGEITKDGRIKSSTRFSEDDAENETIYKAIENCISCGKLSCTTKGGESLDITWTIEEGIGWQMS